MAENATILEDVPENVSGNAPANVQEDVPEKTALVVDKLEMLGAADPVPKQFEDYKDPVIVAKPKPQSVPLLSEAASRVETTTLDMPSLIAEDVAMQRGDKPQDLNAEFEAFLNTPSDEELERQGFTTVGDIPVSKAYLDAAKTDPNIEAELFAAFVAEKGVPKQAPENVVVPFSGPDYTGVRIPSAFDDVPESVRNDFVKTVEETQGLAKIVSKDSSVPLESQKIILEGFRTGAFWEEFRRDFRAVPGDVFRLPVLGAMVVNAGQALAAAITDDDMDKSWQDVFKEVYEAEMRDSASWLTPYEKGLDWTVALESRDTEFQRWFKDSFIKKYGKDMWTIYYQRPSYEITTDEAGAKQLTEVLDENGDPVLEDVGLPPEVVSDLLDASYQSLTSAEKSFLFFGVQAPISALLTARGLTKSQKYIEEIDSARKANPMAYRKTDKAGREVPMNDYEVHVLLQQEKGNVITRTFNKAVSAITFGQFGSSFQKGNIARGRNFNEHLGTIQKYDDEIAILSDKIDSGKLSGKELQNAVEEKNFLEKGLKNYVRTQGGTKLSAFNNPYARSVLADDMIISVAMGYAPTVIDWNGAGLNEGVATTLTSIAVPLVAPTVTRFTINSSLKLADAATSGTIKDIGLTLENSSLLPFISEGMLLRGDEGEMRRTLKEMNITPTEAQVQSFNTISKMFKAMTPDGRIRSYRALRTYNETIDSVEDKMRSLKDIDGSPVFSEQEIMENMSTLHLTLAHATGLAPLISLQARKGRDIKTSDLTSSESMAQVFAALAQEENIYKGMDTLLDLFNRRLAEKGVSLDSNEPLQNMLLAFEKASSKGKDKVSLKRQEYDKLLTDFYQNTDQVDENTINEIVKLKTLLLPEELRGQVDTAKEIATAAENLVKGARQSANALKASSANMSMQEVLDAVRPLADRLFNVEQGRRQARVSEKYGVAREYTLPDGSNVKLDMDTMLRKLVNLSGDMKDQPLETLFRGTKAFWADAGGEAVRNSFENMAKRGLANEFGKDQLEPLFKAAQKKDSSIQTYTDLALYMGRRQLTPEEAVAEMQTGVRTDVAGFRFFEATGEEAESVYRYFRDRSIKLNSQKAPLKGDIPKTSAGIAREFKETVNSIYLEADPSGGYLDRMKTARLEHEKLIGEGTEKGTWAGSVLDARIPRDAKTIPAGQGLHMYKSVSGRPEAPFINISKLATKLMNETDPVKIDDLKSQIIQEKERVMYWVGATTVDGKPAFDLRDPLQREVADLTQQVIETLVGKSFASVFEGGFEKIAQLKTLKGQDPIEAREATARVVQSAGTLGQYDFSRANRIQEMESELFTVPVISEGPDGAPITETRVLFVTDEVKGFADTFDTLLKNSQDVQKTFNNVRDNMENTNSQLRIAAQREVDRQDEAVRKLSQVEQLIERPENFFDKVFENSTPESLDRQIKKFKDAGINEDEIRTGLQYMYVRGLFSKSGNRYVKGSGMNDAAQEIGDVTVLIDHLNDPTKRAVMNKVLGDEGVKDLEEMATWANSALGDGHGFRVRANTRGMSIDSAIARTFNLARGMVGPEYVAVEAGLRLMLQRNQRLLSLAVADRQASRVLAKMLRKPKSVTPKEIELLGLRIQNWLVAGPEGLIRSGGELPTVEALLNTTGINLETKTTTELAREEEERRQQELREVATQ